MTGFRSGDDTAMAFSAARPDRFAHEAYVDPQTDGVRPIDEAPDAPDDQRSPFARIGFASIKRRR